MSGQWCGSCGRLVTAFDEACPACGTSRRVVAPIVNPGVAPRAQTGRAVAILAGASSVVVLLVASVLFTVGRASHEPPASAMRASADPTRRSVTFPSTALPTTPPTRRPAFDTPPPDVRVETPVSRWTVALPPGPVPTGGLVPIAWKGPYLVGDTVVVRTWESRLVAFDAHTGAPTWEHDRPDRLDLSVQPRVRGLAAGTETLAIAEDAKIRAVDVHTGAVLWSGTTSKEGMFAGDATHLVHVANGRIASVDLRTGAPLWNVEARASEDAAIIAIAPGLVVVSSSGTVRGLDLTSGAQRWIVHPDVNGTPEVGASAEVVWLADRRGNVVQLDAADGTERWNGRAGLTQSINDLQAEADGTVILISEATVVAISRTGNELWRAKVGPFPVLTDDAIISTTTFGYFVADLATGAPRVAWTIEPPNRTVASKPVVTDDLVIVAVLTSETTNMAEGNLVAYPRP